MPGIPREVAEHQLNIKPGSRPVRQRLRRFSDDKCKAIGEEIKKLLSAGFIREVHHPEWLANPVLVNKKNNKCRICVDYTGLNKACPKDPFPLPRIDQVWVRNPMFSRRLLRLPPDRDESGRPARHIIHHTLRCFLLCVHAIRAEECRRHVPTMHATRLWGSHQHADRGLHR